MASTNFTTHYSIPLPLGTDLTTPMDYNEAAEDIDTALFGAVTDAGNASEAAGEAVNTANTASAAVDAIGADLALEKAKIVQLQTRMTAAENDIDDVYTDVTDMITAYKESSATSTHAYAIGDYFIYNETLYKATAAITVGATIVPNTNCETTNVSSELIRINDDLADVQVDLSHLIDNGNIGTVNLAAGTNTTIATIPLPTASKARIGFISVQFNVAKLQNNIYLAVYQGSNHRENFLYIPANLYLAPTTSIVLPISIGTNSTEPIVLKAWSEVASAVDCVWEYIA